MISREEVLQLAELARLTLDDSEVLALQKDISNILEYVGQVSAISDQGSTLAQGFSRSNLNTPAPHNVMREDAPAEVLGAREDLLAAFPKRQGDYNVVRKIIQKDE